MKIQILGQNFANKEKISMFVARYILKGDFTVARTNRAFFYALIYSFGFVPPCSFYNRMTAFQV